MREFNYQRELDKGILWVTILVGVLFVYLTYHLIDWETFNFALFGLRVGLNFIIFLCGWQFIRLEYISGLKRLRNQNSYLQCEVADLEQKLKENNLTFNTTKLTK